MSYIKADNDLEQKHFNFLERLRQTVVTNMWGAAKYLRDAFPKDFRFNDKATVDVLAKWMGLHDNHTAVVDDPFIGATMDAMTRHEYDEYFEEIAQLD